MTDWRFSRYSDPVPGFCSRPAVMVNVHDSTQWHLARCGSARPSRCEPCAEIKRADIAAVGRSGWTDSVRDRGYFTTLTAPGADRLPWDLDVCRHSAGVPCSGKIGCRVQADALAIWHHDVGQRWSWFVTEVRRLLPGVDVQFFKTWEPQHRGALHVHSMMRVTGPVTDRRFRAAVKLAARRWGFGDQCDVQMVDLADPVNAARKAGYCAKYATKSADALPAVRRLNPATGELATGGMRAWSASRSWGDTMAATKLRRCQWAQATARAAALPTPGPLDSYQDHYASDDWDGIVWSAIDTDSLV